MQMLRKAHWQPRIELEYCVYVFCDKMQNLQSIFTYFRVSCLGPTQTVTKQECGIVINKNDDDWCCAFKNAQKTID